MNYYLEQSKLLNSEIRLSQLNNFSSQLIIKALLKEICLSPKPGLVDLYNTGSHQDMNFSTFVASIKAISPWFDQFYQYGQVAAMQSSQDFLIGIRPIGIQCEQAMFNATQHINTHKGGIFAFGLLQGAIGKLEQLKQTLNYQTICSEVAKICCGMVDKELQQQHLPNTVGEKLFKSHHLSGARGEAESGYITVREISLPIFSKMLKDGYGEEESLLQAFLYLLAYNQDTNIVSRGGISGLEFVQNAAKKLIKQGGICHENGKQFLHDLDSLLIKQNLSPGGSADLIAVTWFLYQYS